MRQTAIPCLLMRGGTSKGPFVLAADLPTDTATSDHVQLAALGSPDQRQIDGLGGAHPLTSQVAIVTRSQRPEIDLQFQFAQLQPDRDGVDTHPNCGNVLAAVLPFALETGLVAARGETSTSRVLTLDTDMTGDMTVQTPDAEVRCEGEARIEALRQQAALAMGPGSVSRNNNPNRTLIAAPRQGGTISARGFIPHVCHEVIGVLAAVTVATACVPEGSVCQGVSAIAPGRIHQVALEHPTGEFGIALETGPSAPQRVTRYALLRTARLPMRGGVTVPGADRSRG